MTEETVRHAEVGVDASSIVFAHSMLDVAPLDDCRVTALASPHDWESVLYQRQIKIPEARELKYEEVLKKKLDEYLEQLERESHLKKVDAPLPDANLQNIMIQCAATPLTGIA